MKNKISIAIVTILVVALFGIQFGIEKYLKIQLDQSIEEVRDTGQVTALSYMEFNYSLFSNSATVSDITLASNQKDQEIEVSIKNIVMSNFDFTIGAPLHTTVDDVKIIFDKSRGLNLGITIASIETKGSNVVDGVIQNSHARVNKIQFMPGREPADYTEVLKQFNLTPDQAYATIEVNVNQDLKTNSLNINCDLDVNQLSQLAIATRLDSVPIKELTNIIENIESERGLQVQLLPLLSGIILKTASINLTTANEEIKDWIIKTPGQSREEMKTSIEMLLPMLEETLLKERKPETLKLIKTLADYATSNKQSISIQMETKEPISALFIPIMMAYNTQNMDAVIKRLSITVKTK